MTNLQVITEKSNTPHHVKMAVAKKAMVEPQLIKYKKQVEVTPFEQFELDQIEIYQNKNRGFYSDENEPLENNYYED